MIHRGLAKPALATTNVNLRNGPGTDSAIVTTIPGGSTVRVSGCNGEWCAVTWNGRSGFAIARSLDAGTKRQARLPLPADVAAAEDDEPDAPVVYASPGYYPPPPVVYGRGYYGYYGPRYYYRPGWRRGW